MTNRTKIDRKARIRNIVLIVLLGAGIVSLLGGSYIGSLSFSNKSKATNNPTSTPSTATTTSSTTSTTEMPEITVYGAYNSPDGKLSIQYPLTWISGSSVESLSAVLSPIDKYQAKSMFNVSDDKLMIGVRVNKSVLPKTLDIKQFADEINNSLIQKGWNAKVENSTIDGPIIMVDLNLKNNNLSYRLQYKILFVSLNGDYRTAYVVVGASLEKDWISNLSEFTNLINSARIK